MIDLHSHILPGIDDGSRHLEMSLEMARIAVGDGIRTMACTPHIYPGLYMNDSAGIQAARDALQAQLDAHGIALQLTTGADVHLVPGLLGGLRAGTIPTLHGTRYLLLEPQEAMHLTGTISGGPYTGLEVSGLGRTVTLSGNNTYGGTTTVSNRALVLAASDTALGSSHISLTLGGDLTFTSAAPSVGGLQYGAALDGTSS